MKNFWGFCSVVLFFSFPSRSFTQVHPKEFSLVFGLNQPLFMQGFNFETVFWTKQFVVDYSHGFSLKLRGPLLAGEPVRQHLSFNLPHSIGVGIGYRINENLNLRLEPKFHLWQVYYNNELNQKNKMIKQYTTYTLGLGAYYRLIPFKNKVSVLKGLTLVPSVRWWPNVHSSLKNNQFNYFNHITAQEETHNANNIGIANTPFFYNISIGYTFQIKNVY